MRRVVDLLRVRSTGVLGPETIADLRAYDALQGLAGYVTEQPPVAAPTGAVRTWCYLEFVAGGFADLQADVVATQPSPDGTHPQQLRSIGRLVRVGSSRAPRHNRLVLLPLRPVRGGQTYRIASPVERGLVTPVLAEALEAVFERFASERGYTPKKPLEITLARGFKARSWGHGEGRAADIAAVGGKGLLEWKREWDRSRSSAEKLPDPQQRADAIATEQNGNLGYGLYRALQEHGGWRVNQGGWRVYRGVMQLFGPWTATEGPWKSMRVEGTSPWERQWLADQRWVFRAHQDHIHVAR